MLVPADMYGVHEVYEPEVWRRIMSEVRPEDVVADVGAYIGLYTVALARRVGPQGRVYAFEPDAESFTILRRHVIMNGTSERVQLLPVAVGESTGTVAFTSNRGSESHIGIEEAMTVQEISVVTLDSIFSNARVDLLKIDVEGFKEPCAEGCGALIERSRAGAASHFCRGASFRLGQVWRD